MPAFTVGADAYDRFMGRYSMLLAAPFADFAGVVPGQRALDVGCGPGALAAELVRRVGSAAVAAADPSEQFVAAARERQAEVDVRVAPAERLPFDDDSFDAALAQLVVHFMDDPSAGAREMTRVVHPGGVVAACVWDHGTGRGPLSPFWAVARRLEPGTVGESRLVGSRQGDLAALLRGAGLADVEETLLSVTVEHPGFDDWWDPYELGVGPAGQYVASLGAAARARLRERCREWFGAGPRAVTAAAWAARGRVPV